MAISVRRPCRCGHGKDAHEHYRRGSECSGCGCVGFKGLIEITIRLGRQLPSVVLPEEVPVAYEPYVRPTHTVGLTAVPAADLEELIVRQADEPGMRKQPTG
ncbi:MAG: hypothetical protein ABR549_01360 [Mycobacteriales bacterium]